MFRTTHTLTINIVIPPTIPRDAVIAALHDHSTLMTLQPLVQSFTEIPTTTADNDSFFASASSAGAPIKTYAVTEGITLIPGLGDWGKKYISFRTHFQDTDVGVRSRADAPGGVVVRAEWRVERADGEESFGKGKGKGKGMRYGKNGQVEENKGAEEWQLVEEVSVECAAILMPFVRRSMEGAHRDICRRLLEKVAKEQED